MPVEPTPCARVLRFEPLQLGCAPYFVFWPKSISPEVPIFDLSERRFALKARMV